LPGSTVIGQRIVVIGSTCAGKTTLAHYLSDLFSLPYTELDALHWGPNWEPAPTAELRKNIQNIVSRERWVIDGNYAKLRDIIWSRADTLIWLDYPLPVVLWRWLIRTSQRVLTRKRLWNNNRETLGNAFFSSDSLFFWILRRFHNRRREYQTLLTGSQYNTITRVHLKHPRLTRQFLASVHNLTVSKQDT
jgi:adenylate kinase family enzyme